MLIEQTSVPAAALPLAQFKDHLRLGTGFDDDNAQDVLLEAFLRAAIAAVEGRTAKVLLAHRFTWILRAWRHAGCETLPLAPVRAVEQLRLVDRAGAAGVVDPAAYRLERDAHAPCLAGCGGFLPAIPAGGSAEVDFEAGFGPEWDDVPCDLAQAVFLLAAHYHENRHEAATGEGAMPFGVLALTDRWRRLRLTAGGAK